MMRLLLVVGMVSVPAMARGMGAVWEQQTLRYPVAVAELQPIPPFVPGRVPEVRGIVEVGPQRAAAVWLDAAHIVRVQAVSGTGGATLRFGRVSGQVSGYPEGGRIIINEPGFRPTITGEEATWYLVQPPHGADIWFITADSPTRVLVQRPTYRTGRLIWEVLHDEVLAWIDKGGPLPQIPVAPGSDGLARTLRVDEAIGAAIARAYPDSVPLRRAITDWRKASALTAMSAVRPMVRPFMVRTRIDRDWAADEVVLHHGAEDDAEVLSLEPYRAVTPANPSWKVTLRGPGVLHVEARALLDPVPGTAANAPAGGAPHDSRPIRLELTADGALLASDSGPLAPAIVKAEPFARHALPDKQPLYLEGSRVSLKRQILVPLLAGTHTYRIALDSGPALVRGAVVRRRKRLRETVQGQSEPDELIAGAARHLSHVPEALAPARALLDMLLDDLRTPAPRFTADIHALPPLLALLTLTPHTRAKALPEEDAVALGAQVMSLLDEMPAVTGAADSLLAWHLRARFARAFRRWNQPELAQRLLEQDGRFPESAPHELAFAIGALIREPPAAEPSRLLRAAQIAWAENPTDPSRRRGYISMWHRKTRWSLMSTSPASEPREPAPRPWTWLAPQIQAGCNAAGEFERVVMSGGSDIVHAPLGTECRVVVPALPAEPGRLARLRVHLFTTDDQPGPITVRIGESAWNTLGFERMESLEIAVAPGAYPVRIDAPAATVGLIEIPSQDPARAREGTPVRRRRPIRAPDNAPVSYTIPGQAGGTPVLIELREVLPEQGPADNVPLPVQLRADTGWSTELLFQPGPGDTTLIPLKAPGALTVPVRFVIWLPEGVRRVWFEAAGERRIVAALYFRRPHELPAGAFEAAAADAPDVEVPADVELLADAPEEVPGQARAKARKAGPEPGCADVPAVDVSTVEHPLIARLYALSRCVLARPERPSDRLERGALLLDLGRGDYARPDVEAVAAGITPEAPWYTEYRALEQRLRDWHGGSYLRPQPRPEQFAGPTPIAPPLLALEATAQSLQPWVHQIRAARAGGPEGVLAGMSPDSADPVAAYVYARLSRLAGRREQAARVLVEQYLTTGVWQLGVDALRDLRELIVAGVSPPQAGSAAIAYGLATELRGVVEHADIRRALVEAGKHSQRKTVRGVDSHAGYEQLYGNDAEADPDPEDLISWAWMAPPWRREESRLIRPGRGARFSVRLTTPASFWVEGWCRSLDGLSHPCELTTWIDQRRMTSQVLDIRDREPTALLTPARLGPGDHVIEVVLGAEPEVMASVRLVADRALDSRPDDRRSDRPGHAVSLLHPARMVLARPGKPITLTLAGPLTLTVRARTSLDAPASAARVTATHLAGGATTRRTIVLAAEEDPATSGEPGRRLRVSRAGETALILPGTGAYRVTLSTAEGLVMAGFAARRDLGAEPELDGELPVAIPGLPDIASGTGQGDGPKLLELDDRARPVHERLAITVVHADAEPAPPWRSSTFAAESGVGVDDFGAGDAPDSAAPRLDMGFLWRRQALRGRLWLGADAWLRSRLTSSPASGLRARVHARRLPGELRFDADATLAAQSDDIGWAFAAGAGVTTTRAFSLAPSLLGIASLGADLRWYNRDAPPHSGELDPRVYSSYGRAHDRALVPRASLYWMPFQEQAAILSVQAASNADLASLDHVAVRGAWRGLVELTPRSGPVLELSYRVSRRLADDHRFESYIRHDPGIALSWPLMRSRGGRLVLETQFQAYLSHAVEDQVRFRVGLRYDWTGGRGLFDLFPSELRFDDYEEPRLWSPLR